jgi:damage-control phosphatase, subfamily I
MKTYLDCIPCFMDQAIRACRICGVEKAEIKKLLDEVGGMIKDFPLDISPPATGDLIYGKIREITGVIDPYKTIKKETIEEAKMLYPELKEIIVKSDNRLLTAVRIAIAGNVIDFGLRHKFNIAEDVKAILDQDFGIFHFEEFKQSLEKAESILYLGDNAGESVFDKLLIEELGKPVTYIVRDVPVINDVTMQDAIDSGLDTVAELISSGSSAPAIIPELCSRELLNHFEKAEMIISKGQGNYEGLSDSERPVFFLLKAKCQVLAGDLGVEKGDIVLASSVKGTKF